MVFPWQISQWQMLWRSRQAGRLSHALLFSGQQGLGKQAFAESFARALLCQTSQQTGSHCGLTMPPQMATDQRLCHACRLIVGRAHPNVVWVLPEAQGSAIKIDAIREVTTFINQTALSGGYRIVIIDPAHAMNASAANALLKTLEEPTAGAILILISNQRGSLPATIRSRCQRVDFQTPTKEMASQWLMTCIDNNKEWSVEKVDVSLLLTIAQGSPFSALKLLKENGLLLRQQLYQALYELGQQTLDPITVAANLQKFEPDQLFDFSLSWLMDLLRLQFQASPASIKNKDYQSHLSELATKTQIDKNIELVSHVQAYQQMLTKGINLNKQLMIESLLIRWSNCA